MKVINDGIGIIIEATYHEAAILTLGIQRGIRLLELDKEEKYAKKVENLLNQLLNKQEVKVDD